jgi:hypothetical protein
MSAQMDTRSVNWTHGRPCVEPGIPATLKLNRALSEAAGMLAFALCALAVIAATGWAISLPALIPFVQASVWAGGFVFLGLALDSGESSFGLYLLSGFGLLGLALLSSFVAPEFLVLGSALSAAWLTAKVYRW